ncbi:hypothetical protein [Sinorhizobium medicae]|uniref:hypothetical protein n=1 Tax=Sinorhizobium medicae TaxID=110321 RepID=UPI0012949DCD|nr:hypothetical protein [Sinorhizobium medicae]MQX78118.1 hypothetical protein [Sinorhizobium medicae]
MKNEIHFDDFGFDGKLAIVDGSSNHEWVEPTITSLPSESCVRLEIVANDGEGDEHARELLRDHLAENYLIDVPCDFRDEADVSRAVEEVVAIRDRFLAGQYAPLKA